MLYYKMTLTIKCPKKLIFYDLIRSVLLGIVIIGPRTIIGHIRLLNNMTPTTKCPIKYFIRTFSCWCHII